MSDRNDTIQFQGQEVGKAVNHLKDLRIEELNVSKLAREGLKDKLREVTSGDEKATIFSLYQRGEMEEEVARVFLGDHLDTMAADAEEVRAGIDDDVSDLIQRR
jgi:hypothetical protein